MSKELADLMVIITACACLDTEFISSNECVKKFETIKNALKEKENQDNMLKTLKEVIEFGKTLPQIKPNKDNGFDILSAVGIHIQRDIENEERKQLRDWILKTCFPKELKALEIIEEKNVCIHDFMKSKTLDEYNSCREYEEELTQEEYDLLKEVLM